MGQDKYVLKLYYYHPGEIPDQRAGDYIGEFTINGLKDHNIGKSFKFENNYYKIIHMKYMNKSIGGHDIYATYVAKEQKPVNAIYKYKNGTAYYYVSTAIWDNIVQQVLKLGANPDKSKVAFVGTHLISNTPYPCTLDKIDWIEWENVPIDYKYDAWNTNQVIKDAFPKPVKRDDDIMEDVLDLSKQNTKLRADIATIEEHLSKSISNNQQLQRTINELRNSKHHQQLQEVNNTLNHKVNLTIREITTLRDSIKEAEAAYQELDKELGDVNEIYEALIKDFNNLKTLYAKSQAENIELKRGIRKPTNTEKLEMLRKVGEVASIAFKEDYQPKASKYLTSGFEDMMESDNIKQNKTNNMNLSNLMPNLKFGKLEGTSLAWSMAGIAVKRDNNYVVYDKATKTLIEVGDMKMDVDFYQIPVQALVEGDFTIIDGQYLIVDRVNADGSISCIHPGSGSKTTKVARTNLFNMYFYTKIVSMFDFMGGIAGGNTTNTPFGNINPMMFMMMGDKTSGSSNMMEMMMMSQMFAGGNTPFGQPAVAKKAPVKRKPKFETTTVKVPAKKVTKK